MVNEYATYKRCKTYKNRLVGQVNRGEIEIEPAVEKMRAYLDKVQLPISDCMALIDQLMRETEER